MIIIKVKKIKNGFLVNDKISFDKNNSEYKFLKKFIDNGGFVEPEFSFEELKQNKILNFKSKISNQIEAEYSLKKQINIIGRIHNYTDKDFKEMNNFISEKLTLYNLVKNQINSTKNIQELDLIIIED